jgi:hypothetical protein
VEIIENFTEWLEEKRDDLQEIDPVENTYKVFDEIPQKCRGKALSRSGLACSSETKSATSCNFRLDKNWRLFWSQNIEEARTRRT